jgi:DNA-binding transcriptional LysR family regulator
MDRIEAIGAFVTSVERGSLAAAARKLGCSPAKVTRLIGMLEKRLGTRLLHRNTRALHLTQFGEAYLATCGEVLRLMDAAEHGAATERERPYGLLTVTAPLRFGQLFLRPVLDAFLDANPDVQARLILLDRVTNLVEEGIDIAVRIGHLPDSTLIAARLDEVRRVLVAAPAYLKRCGIPRTPSMLREHACIMERDGAETDLWRFSAPPRKGLVPTAVRPRLRVNSAEAAVDSAVDGHGIARVMSYQAATDVVAGKLVVLLAQYEPPPIPVHLLLPSARSKTAKQRSFVEFATPQLRSRLIRAAKEIDAKRPPAALSRGLI